MISALKQQLVANSLLVSPNASPLQEDRMLFKHVYDNVYDGRSYCQTGHMLLTLSLISTHLVSPLTQIPVF